MLNYNLSAQLPTNTPMTVRQLLAAAVAARTHSSAQVEYDAVARIPARVSEGFIRPVGADVYMMDAYKGVGPDGAAVAAQFTLPGDFTAVPGGGELITDGTEKHFNEGFNLGGRLVYQNSGGNVTVYFDVSAG